MNAILVTGGSTVQIVLGFAYKEHCPDLRNSRVVDIVHALSDYSVAVDCYDPWIDREEARREHGIACPPPISVPGILRRHRRRGRPSRPARSGSRVPPRPRQARVDPLPRQVCAPLRIRSKAASDPSRLGAPDQPTGGAHADHRHLRAHVHTRTLSDR